MADFPYPGKFTFVDVEIPNLNNDCICAISMIVIDEGKEIVRTTELINPKTFFSANNIKIHNIHRKDVLDKRTLKQFWADYGQYFEEPYIIGAHNAMSDISVLNKDLARINTEIHASSYIDTMDIMDQFYYRGNQKKGDLRLCNIAKHLDIAIDHHNPESDVNACYEIVCYMHRHFQMDLDPFIKEIRRTRMKPSKHHAKPSTRQMKLFLAHTRNQIKNREQPARISCYMAKRLGDKAFENGDYEGVIFNYEVAASKGWQHANLYLRLAEIYLSLNMSYDALRILNTGIRTLKRSKNNFRSLKRMQGEVLELRRKEAIPKEGESSSGDEEQKPETEKPESLQNALTSPTPETSHAKHEKAYSPQELSASETMRAPARYDLKDETDRKPAQADAVQPETDRPQPDGRQAGQADFEKPENEPAFRPAQKESPAKHTDQKQEPETLAPYEIDALRKEREAAKDPDPDPKTDPPAKKSGKKRRKKGLFAKPADTVRNLLSPKSRPPKNRNTQPAEKERDALK